MHLCKSQPLHNEAEYEQWLEDNNLDHEYTLTLEEMLDGKRYRKVMPPSYPCIVVCDNASFKRVYIVNDDLRGWED